MKELTDTEIESLYVHLGKVYQTLKEEGMYIPYYDSKATTLSVLTTYTWDFIRAIEADNKELIQKLYAKGPEMTNLLAEFYKKDVSTRMKPDDE